MFSPFFQSTKKKLAPKECVQLFQHRAKQALLEEDLETALGFLGRAIHFAPEELDLYLMRAQIYQYGYGQYEAALKDYRWILDHEMDKQSSRVQHAKRGIKEMVEGPVEQKLNFEQEASPQMG